MTAPSESRASRSLVRQFLITLGLGVLLGVMMYVVYLLLPIVW